MGHISEHLESKDRSPVLVLKTPLYLCAVGRRPWDPCSWGACPPARPPTGPEGSGRWWAASESSGSTPVPCSCPARPRWGGTSRTATLPPVSTGRVVTGGPASGEPLVSAFLFLYLNVSPVILLMFHWYSWNHDSWVARVSCEYRSTGFGFESQSRDPWARWLIPT